MVILRFLNIFVLSFPFSLCSNIVDLPAPLCPTRATLSPFLNEKLTCSVQLNCSGEFLYLAHQSCCQHKRNFISIIGYVIFSLVNEELKKAT